MFTLDGSIVNIAIPTLLRVFQASLPEVKWIVLAYLIVIAGLLLPVARLAPYLGQRKIFLAGLVLFTGGSLLCGTAWDLKSLVAFRVLQGTGAVGMASLMSSLVLASVPAGKVGQALGMVTTFATLGTSLGPTVGGFLLAWFGWRSLFLINLPVGMAAIFLVLRFVPRDPPAGSGFSLRALVPDFSVFKIPVFRTGIAGRFLTMAVNGGYLFLAPILLEEALHFSTPYAGVLLATTPVIGGISAPFFGALCDRFGPARFNIAGLLLMASALFLMGGFAPGMSGMEFALRVCLWGLGMGVFNAPNNVCIMKSVPEQKTGTASAMLSFSIILGQVAGVAGMAALFYRKTGAGTGGEIVDLPSPAIVSGISGTLLLAMIPVVLLLIWTLFSMPEINPPPGRVDRTSGRARG